MRRVLIGTPCFDWKTDCRYTHSLCQSIRLATANDIDLRELFPPGNAIIQDARNGIMRDAVKHGFDDLVFVDADQDWQPEDLMQLLGYAVDVVGAAVRRKDDREMYNVRVPQGDESFKVDQKTGLVTAPGMTIGTGFLRLSRRALEALSAASEEYTSFLADAPSRWISDVRPVDGELIGEDTFIGAKLNELGFETWLDPSIVIGHSGMTRWTGSFSNWIARLRREKIKAV